MEFMFVFAPDHHNTGASSLNFPLVYSAVCTALIPTAVQHHTLVTTSAASHKFIQL